jgi:hypothetical protein
MKIKVIFLISLMALAGACKKAGGAGAAGSADGCSDLDANSARMRCANNNVEFCSSYSKYKWMETQKCAANQKCFISPDGKSGGCK